MRHWPVQSVVDQRVPIWVDAHWYNFDGCVCEVQMKKP